jgi:hypothetical protein
MAAARRRTGERRKPAFDGHEPDLDPADRARGHRVRAGRGGRRKGRSQFGRFLYWGVVVVLWALIGAAGGVAWVTSHLPPIH